MQTFSSTCENLISSSFPSNLPLWARPLVHAKIDGLPPKELRKLVDKGKKDLSQGIVVVFASKDDKVGLAVGVTEDLISKFDAVEFVKAGSEIIGGKGGGGRKDFAQAGGQDQSKIDEAFEKLKTLI